MVLRRRATSFVRTVAAALVGLYALVMLLLAAFWAVAPERTWWIALSNILAPHLFLPLLFIAPLGLLLRSRPVKLMGGSVALLFLLESGPLLVPRAAPPAGVQDAGVLRVVSFNQLYSNRDVEGTLAVLKAQQADIVALQELSTPMVRLIEGDGELVARYPYRWLLPAAGSNGLGLLSRLPFIPLPAGAALLMQAAAVEVAGRSITVINAHPIAPALTVRRLNDVVWLADLPVVRRLPMVRAYNPRRRNEHLEALLEDIDKRGGPLVLAGDLNLADRDPMYVALARRMRDAYAEAGQGFGRTFPNSSFRSRVAIPVPFPLVRIDYIWTRGEITPLRADVVCDAVASDHCMVVAEVRVGGEG